MQTQMLRLDGLGAVAYHQFNDVLDYIWKSPRSINAEMKEEAERLERHLSAPKTQVKASTLSIALYRWTSEHSKLTEVFPYFMATANLFASVALFESYCLHLCKEIEIHSQSQTTGMSYSGGVSRLFRFLSESGINVDQATLRQQVDAALTIRNCLFHANGMLAWSREECKLRSIVAAATYLPADIRANYKKQNQPFDDVLVVQGVFGERVQITNNYAFLATAFLRDHFCGLYSEFRAMYTQSSADVTSRRKAARP